MAGDLAKKGFSCFDGSVIKKSGNGVLKGVSRSFYLSLRLLPREMRAAASLGYLLARSSDTLADVSSVPVELRRQALSSFRQAVAEDLPAPRWPLALLNGVADLRERHLLETADDCLAWLRALPRGEASLIKQVVDTILSGQELDLERFSEASASQPAALRNAGELEDYAWRVAGCVGAFWTKLGFQTLSGRFSEADPAVLEQQGILYGKGLQLVNILRDLPVDLANGRCYLPVADSGNHEDLLQCHSQWVETAKGYVAAGEIYADSLRLRRLRAASRLPALIARQTLSRLEGIEWPALSARVKVPRYQVYGMVLKSLR